MIRYVAAAVVALVLLAIALRSKADQGDAPKLSVPPGPPPVVRTVPGPGGRVVSVKHTLRGSVTRAAIVYEADGEERQAAVETDCRQAGDTSVEDDGYSTVVELSGTIPDGATNLRLILESETGTTSIPIEP